MAFFGLTYLGPKKVFENTLHTKNINDISDKTIREAYRQQERVMGKGTISIDEIRPLLAQVYGQLPPEREIGILTRVCDLNARGPQLPGEGSESGILVRVSESEFMKAVEQLRKEIEESDTFRKIAGVKEVAHEFKSYQVQQEYLHKHYRTKYNPQDKYVKPITTSQEIGWYTQAMVERVDRVPNKSCEETKFAAKFHLISS